MPPFLSFKGRINRKGFAIVFAFGLLYYGVYTEAGHAFGNTAFYQAIHFPLAVVYCIFGLWFILAAGAKRHHDIGNSELWAALSLIPVLNLLNTLYLLFMPGQKEANKYGPPPE